ncbi:hypothetical protein Dimus_000062 [Dionaea muscipula]
MTGGLGYDVPAGRRDGRASLITDTFTNLPPTTADVNKLTQMFTNKGLTQEDMVTLSGAHTIGRSHCTSFNSRLYSYNTTMTQDPTLDAKLCSSTETAVPTGKHRH